MRMLRAPKLSRGRGSFLCAQSLLRSVRNDRCIRTTTGVLETTHKDPPTDNQFNEINIQTLCKGLHKQVFGSDPPQHKLDENSMNDVIQHLKDHSLWDKKTSIVENVHFKLPKLLGKNVEEHFQNLGQIQAEPYVCGAEEIAKALVPPMPKEWQFKRGWSRYDPVTGEAESVDFPDEGVLVFDTEILMTHGDGHFPTLATAVSPTAWYSWCSDLLIQDKFRWSNRPTPEHLIPLETASGKVRPYQGRWSPRLVIGHNVGFDRSFVKEQCYIQGTKLRFLDTMSMHTAVSGFTGTQRTFYMAKKSQSKKASTLSPFSALLWTEKGSMNNLSDVYQHYCGGAPVAKDPRQVFISGTMADIRQDFQALMAYCAVDVLATHSVFQKLWPMFRERFPHPVTLAGMLEMGSAYLPVNNSWDRYIQASCATYHSLQRELQLLLQKVANEACELLHQDRYKQDVWLWDLDWAVQDLVPKKTGTKQRKTSPKEKEKETTEDRVKRVLQYATNMPKRSPHMPGFPKWYTELCPRVKELNEGQPAGPSKITTSRRITPKLLRLTWDGYPLHYDDTHGWGYLVPGRETDNIDKMLDAQEEQLQQQDDISSCLQSEDSAKAEEAEDTTKGDDFPVQALYKVCRPVLKGLLPKDMVCNNEERMQQALSNIENCEDPDTLRQLWREVKKLSTVIKRKIRKSKKAEDGPSFHKGDGPYEDASLPGAWFFKLPHKDGEGKRVGNPLSKDFLSKIEEGVLRSGGSQEAKTVLKLSKMCSYWKNSEDRIRSQMVVSLKKGELPKTVTRHESYDEDSMFGCILPRVVTAGTVSRRAVEKTWLTASNTVVDRVGSELKGMVQSPPGYHFVGADVDSQELWIAAVLGDAHFAGVHGCTALGWMALQGNKAEGTDLHSKTASLVGIGRDQAKLFNYGRIYGAGRAFAQRVLMQYNHRLTKQQAATKATVMYDATKGKRKKKFIKVTDPDTGLGEVQPVFEWHGGSESQMFNKLEQIATSEQPRTPVLGCRISRALEPKLVNTDFMTSRVNWVVQSSAVDYLHLMLVCMRWLLEEFRIDGRFSISIHDEVRYLVKSQDTYRAALALQITNLLVRSMFARKLGFADLPQSVAFFSAVDIDRCIRKEVTMDCQTPSNPRGLARGYNIPTGEALNIYQLLKLTNGSLETAKQPRDSQTEDVTASTAETAAAAAVN